MRGAPRCSGLTALSPSRSLVPLRRPACRAFQCRKGLEGRRRSLQLGNVGLPPRHGARRVAPPGSSPSPSVQSGRRHHEDMRTWGAPRPWRSASRRPRRVHEFHLRRQVPITVATFRSRKGTASGTRTQNCSLPLRPGITLVLVGRCHLGEESTQRGVVVFAPPGGGHSAPKRPPRRRLVQGAPAPG